MTKITFPLSGENVAQCMAERDADIAQLRADFDDCNFTREALKQQVIKLRAALVELKCHLYAQEAMTDREIIAACRVIADRALANEEG